MLCNGATARWDASGSTGTCAIGRWASNARGGILILLSSSTSAPGVSEDLSNSSGALADAGTGVSPLLDAGDALEVEWRKGRKTGCGEAADVAARIVTFEYHHRKAVSFPYGQSIMIPETEERWRSFKVVAPVWPIDLQEFDEVLPQIARAGWTSPSDHHAALAASG